MTDYNKFCYSENYGDEYSSRQSPFRIFNKEVSKEEYNSIIIPNILLKFDATEAQKTRFQTAFKNAWKDLDKETKKAFLTLPHFDAGIFERITGIKYLDEWNDIHRSDDVIEEEKVQKPVKVTFHDGDYSLTATYEARNAETVITMTGLNHTFWFCRSNGDVATAMVKLMKQATDFIPEATKLLNNN